MADLLLVNTLYLGQGAAVDAAVAVQTDASLTVTDVFLNARVWRVGAMKSGIWGMCLLSTCARGACDS